MSKIFLKLKPQTDVPTEIKEPKKRGRKRKYNTEEERHQAHLEGMRKWRIKQHGGLPPYKRGAKPKYATDEERREKHLEQMRNWHLDHKKK